MAQMGRHANWTITTITKCMGTWGPTADIMVPYTTGDTPPASFLAMWVQLVCIYYVMVHNDIYINIIHTQILHLYVLRSQASRHFQPELTFFIIKNIWSIIWYLKRHSFNNVNPFIFIFLHVPLYDLVLIKQINNIQNCFKKTCFHYFFSFLWYQDSWTVIILQFTDQYGWQT